MQSDYELSDVLAEDLGDVYSDLSSELDDDISWVEWYCGLKGNEFFVEVDEEYIRDEFNLTGLSTMVSHYNRALDIILDHDDEEENIREAREGDEGGSVCEQAAQVLYGLIHARFILTARGLQLMLEKFQACTYGYCPNSNCNLQVVMPIGLDDLPNSSPAKVFCPRCNEVYHPRSARLAMLDGAYFGSTFPHLFFLMHEHLVPKAPISYYEPRVFGFRVHRNVKDMLKVAHPQTSAAGHRTTARTLPPPTRRAGTSSSSSQGGAVSGLATPTGAGAEAAKDEGQA